MRYKIFYISDYHGAEEIDTAENKKEALTLVSEYKIAFNSNKVSYKRNNYGN